MYDTVRAYVKLDAMLDTTVFDGYRAVLDSTKGHESVRHWINDTGDNYTPRLDWYHDVEGAGMLAITFSMAKMANIGTGNLTEAQASGVLQAVDTWLDKTLNANLPSIGSWVVTRIDYAYNFDVDDVNQLRAYLLLISQCQVATMVRHPYDDSGVLFKNNSRWIKFYDKSLEMGIGGERRYLRYEVSNLSAGVKYMCKYLFGCERTVSSLVNDHIAGCMLRRSMEALGLDNPNVYKRDEYTMYALREAFGRSAMSAMSALQLIHQHGVRAYKEELMTQASFYRWRTKLRTAGFLPMSDSSSLSPLSLPKPF